MNVVIIEDEQLSADRIKTLLDELDPLIHVVAMLDSVKSTVEWFRKNKKPELVFMDIQLADGLSFDIFEMVKIECPIIFITAYHEYAIKAFKVNSVDYLLKPVSKEDLKSSVEKYIHFFSGKKIPDLIDKNVLQSIKEMIRKPYKNRFLVKAGEKIRSVEVNNILYFYSLEKGIYLHTDDKHNYAIDYTLDALADLLDPEVFFRVNRRYIISHAAITEMISLSGSKLKVHIQHSDDQEIFISRERLGSFKDWLDE